MEKRQRLLRVEELFHAALALAPDRRGTFLDHSCASDPEMLAEVQSLISMHENPGDFMKSPAYEVGSDLLAGSETASLAGRTLGHYDVLCLIGFGGMGEVYRARDNKLGREVAVKVLPEVFARDALRLKRLEREARILASLNHPNIATLHGIEEFDNTCFLVMELLAGESLDQRLALGPVPVRKVLDFLHQIAAALEAAHDKGVIHRDLKPANIKLTPGGKVKVLDFGLAKAVIGEKGVAETALESTLSVDPGTGLIMGTPPYLSPEQARGETVDKRTDIWAFGCVAFEALAGQKAFTGKSIADVLSAILHEEPDWAKLPEETPAPIRNLVKRCLRKDPDARMHDIADARLEIEEALSDPASQRKTVASGTAAPAAAVPLQNRLRYLPWSLASLMALAAVAGFWMLWTRNPRVGPVMRFVSPLPQGYTFERTGFAASAIAVSPDGTQVAFAARHGDKTQLFHRGIGEVEAQPIAGTENGRAPFFSPDGKSVGFAVQRDVKVVALAGGIAEGGPVTTVFPVTRADVAFFGADFHPSGNPVYLGECTRGLRACWIGGGREKMKITDVLADPTYATQHQFPQVLPGGKQLLFTSWNVPESEIRVLDLQTHEAKTLLKSATYGRYVPTGHIIYVWESRIYAVPFNLGTLEVTGPPVQVLDGILSETARGAAHFSVSANGTLVYIPGGLVNNGFRLAWVDRKGKTEIIHDAPNAAGSRLSPDGRKIAVSRPTAYGSLEIWTYESARGIWRRLTDERGTAFWAIWSPDGTRIVFNSNLKDRPSFNLYSKLADGSAPEERLTVFEGLQQPGSWTPDGKILAFQQGKDANPDDSDIWMLPMEGNRKPYPFIATRFGEIHPTFSPDGRWLSYCSNESGVWQVMLRPFQGAGEVVQVSDRGGWEPLWSRDGRELYYRSLDGDRIYSASIEPGSPLRVGRAKLVLEGKFLVGSPYGRTYDISPGGERFLVQVGAEPLPPIDHYNVILNWFEELKQRVPAHN